MGFDPLREPETPRPLLPNGRRQRCDKGMARKTREAIAANPRNVRIMELRARHWTYEAIGREVGITHQRVQQIINQIDKTWAGVIPGPTLTKECPNCGKRWTSMRPSDTAKFCSMSCRKAHAARTLTPRVAESAAVILQARRDGKTWREAGLLANPDWRSPESAAQNDARTYARKTGEDVAWAFRGFDAIARAAISRSHRARRAAREKAIEHTDAA